MRWGCRQSRRPEYRWTAEEVRMECLMVLGFLLGATIGWFVAEALRARAAKRR